MKTATTIEELKCGRAALKGIFALVPTMGALHAGHLSLVDRALEECDQVGVSIFVNPAQFGQGEDLACYPRMLESDLRVLRKKGVALVWAPAPEEVYPPGYQTWIDIGELSSVLEGRSRPGHFRGVATVVAKLFNLFAPDRAYFGRKDAQQLAVIRRMTLDLNLPVDIVACPTVREPDGLALSSRNAYLEPAERKAATVLFRALSAAREQYRRGNRDGEAIRAAMKAVVAREPAATLDYVSAADPETLEELEVLKDPVLLSIALRIGRTRLIDNFLLPDDEFPESVGATMNP